MNSVMSSEGTVRNIVFGLGPLAQAIARDLLTLNGFYPRDVADIALEMLTSEVEGQNVLELILGDTANGATREAIRDAVGRTILFHFLARNDLSLEMATSVARADASYGERDVLTGRIVSRITEFNGHMNVAVETVIRNSFDPSTFDVCPPERLIRFFWECLGIETNELGELLLD